VVTGSQLKGPASMMGKVFAHRIEEPHVFELVRHLKQG